MLSEFSPIHQAPFGGEYYVFRDSVHNLIEIEDAEDGRYIRAILRTPELQRLRQIRQNGLSSLVYPSVETTRFPHALGSFHIARRIADSLIERQPTPEEGFPECLHLTKRDCMAFSVAALLHDVGHGPLSHVWEECWAKDLELEKFHEKMGVAILEDSATGVGQLLSNENAHKRLPGIGRDVLRFLRRQHYLDYLLPLLEGNLDVDRLDFVLRDTRAAGVTYGFHDLEWIIRSLRFARLPARYIAGPHPRWVIAIDGRKGLSTLVQFLHARENMYRLVYLHKTTRAATRMLVLLFKRARLLASKDVLSCRSNALQRAIAIKPSVSLSPAQFLKLDDSDIWSSIKGWAEGDSYDGILRDLARRLLSRDLFKVFSLSRDVYERLHSVDSEESGHNLRALVKARLACSAEDAEYYFAFDETTFDVIGKTQDKPWQDVWIMESSALGFEFKTLRDYWRNEVRSEQSATQYLLLVHPDVVQDLAGIVGRLSFPAQSAENLKTLPDAPSPYRLVAPLGSEGAWKEVYVATNTTPGSSPENIVALKCYKTVEGEQATVERDVNAINLLGIPHQHLSCPRLLKHEKGETWIMEPLWTASLEDFIKKHGPRRDILEIFEIAEHLFSGLAQLHEFKLRHTDIKPDNCGIHTAGLGRKTYVLGDFGCLSSTPNTMPPDRRLLGTLRTRAPEVIAHGRISLKSDVWSMAATIYSLCRMEYPFMPFDAPHHDSSDRVQQEGRIESHILTLVEAHKKNVELFIPPVLSKLLGPCFQSEEERRPSARDAFQSFQKMRAELAERTEELFSTAWQRAEDIVQRFDGEREPFRALARDEKQKKEINELVTSYRDFVPVQLRESLERLISSGDDLIIESLADIGVTKQKNVK